MWVLQRLVSESHSYIFLAMLCRSRLCICSTILFGRVWAYRSSFHGLFWCLVNVQKVLRGGCPDAFLPPQKWSKTGKVQASNVTHIGLPHNLRIILHWQGILLKQLKQAQSEAEDARAQAQILDQVLSAKLASLQGYYQAALQREQQVEWADPPPPPNTNVIQEAWHFLPPDSSLVFLKRASAFSKYCSG